MRTYYALVVLVCSTAAPANAQSFRVQFSPSTITHPVAANNNSEPPYNGPTQFALNSTGKTNGAVKCQEISGGDLRCRRAALFHTKFAVVLHQERMGAAIPPSVSGYMKSSGALSGCSGWCRRRHREFSPLHGVTSPVPTPVFHT